MTAALDGLAADLQTLAADKQFSGVVRVDRGRETVHQAAYGMADRAFAVPNGVETVFGVASVAKGLTAVTVMSLAEDASLPLDTTARSVLGDDLPLIDDGVTVQHLLAHRSGIGDYFDEDGGGDITDYVMPVPVHRLASTADYLQVLDGYPTVFPPGERFAYCNSGYVVLALVAERVTGEAFPELVRQRVCARAGMGATAFLRSDELPGNVARGYLHADGLRTNALHLPVLGSGDGGLFTTVGDLHLFWRALLEGRLVDADAVGLMTRAHSDVPEEHRRYGLGFWLDPSRDVLMLEGYDAGVSARTVHDRAHDLTVTVLSNTSNGAWPLARYLTATVLG